MPKITSNDFIIKANNIHCNKYDYSKVEYVNSQTKVCIVCPKHGEFWQRPSKHLQGQECPKCSNVHHYTTEEWVNVARKKHNNKYNYSKVKYLDAYTKICIICPEHGEFWQIPHDHLKGCGCPKCSNVHHYTTEDWIIAAIRKHNNKFDYSKVTYVNSRTKVCIICPKHGEFWQTPVKLLHGNGCPKCKNIKTNLKKRSNSIEFIEKANKIHKNRYDYSKVEYVNSRTKVCIICPKHGEFCQTPHNHLKGKGCYKCGIISNSFKFRSNANEFITKSNIIHNSKYDYSKVNYVNSTTKVCIICPEHGEFWQTPTSHLSGQGCSRCNSSHLENEIRKLLDENNIVFEEQKKFDWLGRQTLDFYLPDHNIAIECQGKQHFEPIEYFGGQENLKYVIQNDAKKHKLCMEHSIKLLYYSNLKIDFPYNVITNDEILIESINNDRSIEKTN